MAASHAPLMPNMPRILVVEDDLDLRFLYSASLSRSGYEVTVAKNAADAMLLLTNQTFDLLILDMNMPDLPGIKIVEFARGDIRLKRVPIVIVSANHLWQDQVLNLGVTKFIVKPVALQDLIAVVNKVLKP